MITKLRLLVAIGSAFIALSAAAVTASVEAKDPFEPPVKNPTGSREGWVLRQRGFKWGGGVWYITDQQIKMSGSFLSMIIDRRTNMVTLYSVKSNRYRIYSAKECGKRMGIYREKKHYVFGPVKTTGKVTFEGVPAVTMVRIGKRLTEDKVRSDVEFRDDIIVAPSIKFSPEINNVIESVFYSVYEYGVPLKMVRSGYIKGRERRSTQSVILSEVYFAKKRPIPDVEFALPKGLKPSQSEMDLLSSDMEVRQVGGNRD